MEIVPRSSGGKKRRAAQEFVPLPKVHCHPIPPHSHTPPASTAGEDSIYFRIIRQPTRTNVTPACTLTMVPFFFFPRSIDPSATNETDCSSTRHGWSKQKSSLNAVEKSLRLSNKTAQQQQQQQRPVGCINLYREFGLAAVWHLHIRGHPSVWVVVEQAVAFKF